MAAVVDAEALGHRDLDAVDVVAVPHGLEHGVRKPQVEQLLDPHLAEEVVDAVELRLVDVGVQLLRQRVGGGQVVAERLLDHDTGICGQAGLGQPFHHRAEEERRDLEVEDRQLGRPDGRADALVRGGVAEVALDVREPVGEAPEHLLVDGLAGAGDGLAGVVAQVVDRPVVDRHAHDRAVEQAARLEPVERMKRHHLGQIAGDPEDHEHVGGLFRRPRPSADALSTCCAGRHSESWCSAVRHGVIRAGRARA